MEQLHTLGEAAKHDQVFNSSDKDQSLADIHLANLLAHHFFFH